MKRYLVSAALLPLALAASARAETKITTAVTTPLKTSTANNGAPDDLTIDTTGSVKPAVAGAAVTLDSNNAVKNAGQIGFNNLDNSTGILALGGHTGSVSNTGSITVTEDTTQSDTNNDGLADGPFASGANRFGIHVTGPGTFTGDIRNEFGASITVKGETSGGLVVDTLLAGNLVNAGAVTVTGDHSVGVSAQHVTGNVQIRGAVSATGEGDVGVQLSDVDGQVLLQSAIAATGYKTITRLDDATRAKLSASELLQGGAAVRIAGSVGKGVLLDKAPTLDANNADVDGDGIPDTQEGNASLASYGAAPALDIGADHATTIGLVGTGDNAFGIVNKGAIGGNGVNDGVGATALRIGQPGGGTTTVQGGINNLGGVITATAFGADVRAQGGDATGVLINGGASVPALRNSGTITATLTGGAQDAYAVRDLSGSLTRIDNTGTISAAVTSKTGSPNIGSAVALDLSVNTSGVTVTQANPSATATASITGDIRFGSGNDQLLVSGGTITGNISFGGGSDFLRLDNGSVVTGAISSAGGLGVFVQSGKLQATNTGAVNLASLTVGPSGVLGFTLDPAHNLATHFNVNGAAIFSDGAQINLNLASVLKTETTFQLINALTVTKGATPVTLAGAPFLYTAQVKTDLGSLSVDIRPKTAAELGLNRSGTEAFSAVIASLDQNPAIAGAILGQFNQSGFQSIYDQMLPDHSGGSLASAQAISSAISQAVGQALPHDGQGGGAIWAQEIAFHIDHDRDQALGYTSQGYGLAAGVESVGEANAVGLNASFVTATYKDRSAAVGERIVMNFVEGGGYWRLRAGNFQADARAGLGYVWFDSERALDTPSLALSNQANWNGWLVDAHAGASYFARLGRFYARPELSLDYVRLSEDGYQESGGGAGFDLKVSDRSGDLLTGQALVAFGWQFGEDSWWSPELAVGWRAKLAGGPGATTAQFQGGNPFILDAEDPSSGGAVVRLGLKGGSDQIYFGLDGGGTFDKGAHAYDFRATVRFRF